MTWHRTEERLDSLEALPFTSPALFRGVNRGALVDFAMGMNTTAQINYRTSDSGYSGSVGGGA